MFYLSSVLRMVSVDTQRVETGHVKCSSVTKDPAVGLPQVGCHSVLFRQLRLRGLLDGGYCMGKAERAAIRAACAFHHPWMAGCSSPSSSPSGWRDVVRMASPDDETLPHHPDGHHG